MTLVYRDGLRLPEIMCHRCQHKRKGVVHRSGPAWDIHLSCGHTKRAGYTMPVDELRKRGLVTTSTPIDPRAVSKKNQEAEDKERQRKEAEDYSKRREHLTRQKYL